MTDSYLSEPEGASDEPTGAPFDPIHEAAVGLARGRGRPSLLFVSGEIRRRHVTALRATLGLVPAPGSTSS